MNNSILLTTHYDVHHTLRDILALTSGRAASESLPRTKYGQSLFERLDNRGCLEAGVMAGYCSCRNGFFKVDSNHPDILDMAESILADINLYLTENQLDFCMQLSLESMKFEDAKKV